MAEPLTALEAKQLEIIQELAKRERENKIGAFEPSPKQMAFYATTKTKTECGLFGGNQVGKSECVGFAVACHATGVYPRNWPGRKFARATKIWIAGEDLEAVRDVQQNKLIGMHPQETGTGFIPKKNIMEVILNSGSVRNVADMILVKHISGGTTIIKTKSYKAGRTDFAGDNVDIIWPDEEPDMDIYMEMLTRIVYRSGIIMPSMTPHKGMTPLTKRLMQEKRDDTALTFITIDDATHLTDAQKEAQKKRYPEHERSARLYGIPRQGVGMVFNIDESEIMCDPFPIPDHWAVLCGLDFTHSSSSEGHPFAMAWTAYDRDTDTAYLYDEFCAVGRSVADHVEAWRTRGDNIPVAWPQDGNRTEAGSNGVQLAQMYKNAGMKMLEEAAMLPEADIGQGKDGNKNRMSVEVGVNLMFEAMRAGRYKVFKTCQHWLQEKRSYFRDDKGQIVKKQDDVISASRYNYVMRRHAVPKSQALRTVRLAPMQYKSRYS